MVLNGNDEHICTLDTESSSKTSSCSSSNDDEYLPQGQILGLQPYQFEPVIDTTSESSESDDDYSSEEEDGSRLDNLEW
jgi:hypothetical protein